MSHKRGRQEDASLTACGPVSVAVGQAGFLLACGSASQTLHMTIVLVASCGATWAPEVHTHARLRVPVKAVFKESYQFEVLNKIYLQTFLNRWVVNRETNLMILINP